jgi:hypothetical protein
VDGLITLLILFFFGNYVVKRFKRLQDMAKSKPTRGDAPQPAPHMRSRRNEKKAPAQQGAITPKAPTTPSQPIQSTLLKNHVLNDYAGSMGAQYGEGQASAEGSTSTEGGEVFAAEILNPVQPETVPATEVLPDCWNGDTLVRAVVMNEIFSRRHNRWSGYHE